MINNEKIQSELEREQEAKEVDTLAQSLLAALSFGIYNLYRQYGTDSGLQMSRGNRKKNFFQAVSGIVSDHYKRVKEFILSKALGAFKMSYELFMSVYEKELDLPLVRNLPEKTIQEEMKKGYSLQKTITYNKNKTLKQLKKQFLESFRIGETMELLTSRISGVVEKDKKRVELVTSQETARMQAQAQYKSMDDADEQGVNVEYYWVSMRDKKVRENHRKLHKKKADENGWFYVDGDKAKHPFMFSKISNNINCRCYLSIVGVHLKDTALQRQLDEIKDSSERRRVWEERIKTSKARKKVK